MLILKQVATVSVLSVLLIGSLERPITAEPVTTDLGLEKVLSLKPQPTFPDRRAIVAEQREAARKAEEARQAELAAQQQRMAYTAPVGSCSDWMAQAGITNPSIAYVIIMRESGCNPNAVNPGGEACGIGQQLPCGKWPHAWNDPVGGMIDMQNYVFARYGSWENALYYWNTHGNY